MTSKYTRSEIYNYCELPEAEQQRQEKEMDYLTPEELDGETFVKDPCSETQFLPLSIFERTNGNPWRASERENKFTHGIFGLTYFSCYTITLNRSNDEATVAYKYF